MVSVRKGLVAGLLLLGAAPAFASYGVLDDTQVVYAGLGVIAPTVGRLTNQASGETAFFGTVLPDLVAMARLGLGAGWYYSPLLAYTPIGHSPAESGERTTYLDVGILRFAKDLGPFSLVTGSGVLLYTVSGSGGSTVLDNGNSQSTFGLPEGSSTSSLYYLEAGIGADLPARLRLDTDALVTGTFSSRRAVDLLMTLSYGVF